MPDGDTVYIGRAGKGENGLWRNFSSLYSARSFCLDCYAIYLLDILFDASSEALAHGQAPVLNISGTGRLGGSGVGEAGDLEIRGDSQRPPRAQEHGPMSERAPLLDDEGKVFKGSAVKNGIVRFLSVSAIKMFDKECDGGCPRKYWFHYVGKKKLEKTKALKKGIGFAKDLEHYLKTGEDVLPPELRPAMKYLPKPGPDIEVERKFATGKDGADILRAIELREWVKRSPTLQPGDPARIIADIRRFAGLAVVGIPIDGAADFRHRRGEYVDSDGELRPEPRGLRVEETGDLKVMARVHPHKILKGKNAGKILPSFAKNAAYVCADVQMLGYGVYSADRDPDLTHVRLSHVSAAKDRRDAVKATGLIPVEQLRERWRRVEGVVEQIEQVVLATSAADVEPNLSACDAYTHVDPQNPGGPPLPGCGHRYYCPLSITQVGPRMMGPVMEETMSLFDQLDAPSSAPANGQSAPAPLDPAVYAAQLEAEKTKLLATMQPQGSCGICGQPLLANQMKMQSLDGVYKHISCLAASTAPSAAPAPPAPTPPVPVAAASAPTPPAPPVPPQPAVGIVPPDVPQGTMLQYADAVPPEAIAEIQDPALRAKVEEHARQQAAAAAQRALEEGATGAVWCKMTAQKIAVTVDMVSLGKYTCECGKQWTYKVLKPENSAITVPKHKPVKVAAPAPPAPTPPVPVAVAPAPTPPVSVPTITPPVPVPVPVAAVAGEMTRMVEGMFGPEGQPSAALAALKIAPPVPAPAVDTTPEARAAAYIARVIIAALEPYARGDR
jgi:hypothetical protein